MKALIVDDEQPAREELAWLLEQCDDVEVVAEAEGAETARGVIEVREGLDVVFLDIDMPGVDGLHLAECLDDPQKRPLVVFVTAYEEFAAEAFDVEAIDYLLKPVRLERLQRAVERVERRLGQETEATDEAGDDVAGESADPNETETSSDDDPLSRVSVQSEEGYRVLDVDDILYFEAVDGDVWAETASGRYATDFSLKYLEARLGDGEFFRCHRSYIVRLEAIESIVPAGAGTYRLQLTGSDAGDEASEARSVPLARSRSDELKRRMPWSDY